MWNDFRYEAFESVLDTLLVDGGYLVQICSPSTPDGQIGLIA